MATELSGIRNTIRSKHSLALLLLLTMSLIPPIVGVVGPTDAAGAAEPSLIVTPLRSGGWNFRWEPVPGATEYTLERVTSDFVGSRGQDHEIKVTLPGSATSTHLPDGPWHTRTGFQERFILTALSHGTVIKTIPNNRSCPDAFFLTARGSGENPPGDGYKSGLGKHGDAIYTSLLNWLDASASTLRVLPVLGGYKAVSATDWHLLVMHDSANRGTMEATALLEDAHAVCKDSPIVMFGFSQGAWVVGDALEQSIRADASLRNQVVSAQLLADAHYGSRLPDVQYYPKDHGGRGISGRPRGPIGAKPGVVTEWCLPTDMVCHAGQDDAHGEIYNTCYRARVAVEAAMDLVALPDDKWSAAGIPTVPSCDMDTMVGRMFEEHGRWYRLKRGDGEHYLKAQPLAGPVTKRCFKARGGEFLDLITTAAIWPEVHLAGLNEGLACIHPGEVRSRAVIPVPGLNPMGYWVDGNLKRFGITDAPSSACYAERSGSGGPITDMVTAEVLTLGSGGRAPVCLAGKGNAGKVLRLRSDQPASGITYLVDGLGERRHIPDVQTLSCLLSWQDRVTVDDLTWAHVRSLPESAAKARCTPPATIANTILTNPNGNSYYVDAGLVRHSIRTTYTYHCLVDKGVKVHNVSQGQMDGVELGGAQANCVSPSRVEGTIIRRHDGISWVVVGGQRRHIPTQVVDVCTRAVQRVPVALTGLDYNAGASIPESTAKHSCALEGTIVQALDQPQPHPAYRISGGKRYWIPDGWTFDYWKRRLPLTPSYDEAVLKELPYGGPEPRKLDPAAVPANTIIRRRDGVSWVVDANKVRHHIPYARDDTCWRLLRGYSVSATDLTGPQAAALPEDDTWPCVVGPRVVKSDDTKSYFVDSSNVRHWIPDGDTFWALSRSYPVVGPWPAAEVANFIPGSDHPRMIDPEAVKNSVVCRDDNVCWAVDGNAVRHHLPTHGDNVCMRWVHGWRVTRDRVSAEQANSLREAEAWGCSMDNRIIATNEGPAYYMEGNTRRWIPDGYDFDCLSRGRSVIRGMGLAEASGLGETSAMPAQECPGIDIVTIYSPANGRYVTTEIHYGGDDYAMVRAARTSVGSDWERFRLIGDCASRCLIQSLNNRKLVLAQLNYQGYAWGELRGVSENAGGSWEGFQISGDCNHGCAIRALGNGRFVSAELGFTGHGYGMLRARAETVSGWERFIIR